MLNGHSQCILAIGKTGNGKSFTGTIFGAQGATIGNSTKSETNEVTIYNIGNNNFYVDTPGFDDSDENKNDDENVRSIFRKLLDAGIFNITTILWFVITDIKATASFKRQAKFIESLAKDSNCNVWENVIIVTKGDTINDGPREAAREIAKKVYEEKHNQLPNDELLTNTKDFAIFLFESLPSTNVYVENNFPSDKLAKYNIFKQSEPEKILAKYQILMREHPDHPIKLQFKKMKCLKCPEETDPRLAISKCHSVAEMFHPETIKIHDGGLKCVHPKENPVDYHPNQPEEFHPGSYDDYKHFGIPIDRQINYNPGECVLRAVTFGIINPTIPGYWDCCGKELNSSGCRQVYSCCKKDNSGCSYRYKCCGKDASNSGCRKKLECCNEPPTSKGCKSIYDVCKHENGEKPCLIVCKDCKNTLDTVGCKSRCRECKNPQTDKGCRNEEHDFI